MKTLIGINTLLALEQPVYASHIQFFYHLGKEFPNDTFALNTPRRMSIDRMRNQSAKYALEMEADYLMFIDDDVVIPVNTLHRLLACDADIAAGWTIIRGYPFNNMFFRHPTGDPNGLEPFPHPELPTEPGAVLKVDAVGFSCVLIKCSLLKKVPVPWFVTGPNNTEDIYFCMKARHCFPETTIVVDLGVKTSHALGTEFIEPGNRIEYTKYCEAAYPLLYIPKEKKDEQDRIELGDRGEEYLKIIKGEPAA